MADDKNKDAVDARIADLGELQPMTPTTGDSVRTSRVSPDLETRGAGGSQTFVQVTERIAGVPMRYVARKSLNGLRMPTPRGEHIDVIAPGDQNAGAAEMYLEQLITGPKTPEMAAEMAKMKESADTLHLQGRTYHFMQGGDPTPAHPDDVAFLESHPGYFIERAT